MKNLYLVGAIVLFIILLVPYFQNVSQSPSMTFFFSNTASLLNSYFVIVFMGLIEGALITLYVQSVIRSVKDKTTASKFDGL